VRGIASSSAIDFLLLAICNRLQHTALVRFHIRYFWNRFRRARMEGDDHRSGCPINLSLEVFGDKWSLLILRDMMFGGNDVVRTRLVLSGTDRGVGVMWYPPTGRRVSFEAEFVDRFSGGELVEHSGEANTEGLLRQLGHHREG
jgi:hypothetical protein